MYRELKQRVFEANMELYRRNLVVYTWGNVSEVDRERGVMAIKPSGVPYESLKPEMIVVQSLETGGIFEGHYRPSSDAPTHLVLYRAFRDVGGIVHTHSTAATAWAQAGLPIPCMGTTHADYFHGEIPVARFLTAEETEEGYEANTGTVIIEAFRGKNPKHTPGALCSGHGPFTWGKDGAEAVHNAVVLEELAKMALMARQLNPSAGAIPNHISDKHFLRKHGPNAYYGQG